LLFGGSRTGHTGHIIPQSQGNGKPVGPGTGTKYIRVSKKNESNAPQRAKGLAILRFAA